MRTLNYHNHYYIILLLHYESYKLAYTPTLTAFIIFFYSAVFDKFDGGWGAQEKDPKKKNENKNTYYQCTKK